jgi:lipid A 4'-phosphatase
MFAALAVFFRAFPAADIAVSSFFFLENGTFLMDNSFIGQAIYYGVDTAAVITAAFFICYIVFSFLKNKETLLGLPRLFVLYLALTYILGPGLVVNELLKDRVGRPRPFQVTYFKGKADFSPAFKITEFGGKYASFVSGHAAFGFYWIALGFPMKNPARRRKYFSGAAFLGTVIGMVRIMQGKHFLSDVVFSFFFVYAVAAIIWFIIENVNRKHLAASEPYG